MKILVTGGTGFIGAHLVGKLMEVGHEVVVMSNEDKSEKDVKTAFVRGDIRDAYDVRRAMEGCELVFHLAALVNIRDASDDELYAINFLGAKNVFEVARAKGAKIIFTSTAAVYGNGQLPNREDGECKPLSQYGKSKLRAEKYLQSLTAEHFIVRLFNVYGPHGKSFLNTICKKIPNYEDVVVNGNGMQTRDYIFVTDVIDALLLGMNNTGLYNVGTGSDNSMMKLIDTVHETTRCKPSVKFALPQKNDIVRSRADITRIRKLGWEPKVGLEEGIKLLLESYGWKPMYV